MSMFSGLSAFPLTPLRDDALDERAFVGLVGRLRDAGVDSITALGSTGSYPYLDRAERARVARLAVEHAAGTPVFVGVGDLRTSRVLHHIDDAEAAGASGLLLAAMSYQRLTDDDVFELFRTATEHTGLPVILYDNPGTTHFSFSIELIARISALPGVAAVKIPSVPADPAAAQERVDAVRGAIPAGVAIGVSGDASAANGLNAGCDAWNSVIAGTLPAPALQITRAAQEGRSVDAVAASERLVPLWNLFTEFGGSIRVVSAIAEMLGLVGERSLPLPLQGLTAPQRTRVAEVVRGLGLTA